MNKYILLAILSILPASLVFSQGEVDAYKLGKNDLTGTARAVSMGGAFGALGGDITGIAINPAGIGVYRSSEVVTTMNFQNTHNKSDMASPLVSGGSLKESKFKFTFDNLAFVASIPTYETVMPLLNVGFSYNKLKSFDRKYAVKGHYLDNSLTNYLAYSANGYAPADIESGNDSHNPWGNNWLAVLGYNSFLVNPMNPKKPNESQGYYSVTDMNGITNDNYLNVREKGSINSYDFNMGTTFADMLSFGMTLAVTDINYHKYASYTEEFFQGTSLDNIGGYDLYNETKTEGSGWQLKTGLIFKPIQELRIGVAYHSPTWYKMTDYYTADLDHDISKFADIQGNTLDKNYKKGLVLSDYGAFDYKYNTPDKWTLSLAGVIGKNAIISVDYELTNYGNMKLYDDGGNNLYWGKDTFNDILKSDFKSTSTVRIGGEYRVTPQLSVRAGYAWMESPFKKELKNNSTEVLVVGSDPHYIVDGDTNHFTCGAGYRFTKNFYLDVAFVMKSQKSDLYSSPTFIYDNVDYIPEKATLKTNTFNGLLTLGFRM